MYEFYLKTDIDIQMVSYFILILIFHYISRVPLVKQEKCLPFPVLLSSPSFLRRVRVGHFVQLVLTFSFSNCDDGHVSVSVHLYSHLICKGSRFTKVFVFIMDSDYLFSVFELVDS